MITDFLKTQRTPEELEAALAVIRDFKQCEGMEEWACIPFAAWSKLEQLEEFLAHKVEGAALAADTIAYIATQENRA